MSKEHVADEQSPLDAGVALAPFGHWIVHSSSLVVYQAANVESQSLGTVEQGHVFQPLTVQPTWVQLYAPDGTVGWCLRHKAHAEKISEDDTDQEMHLLQNLMIYQVPLHPTCRSTCSDLWCA